MANTLTKVSLRSVAASPRIEATASPTSSTIAWYCESCSVAVARMVKASVPLTVPECTSSPALGDLPGDEIAELTGPLVHLLTGMRGVDVREQPVEALVLHGTHPPRTLPRPQAPVLYGPDPQGMHPDHCVHELHRSSSKFIY